MNPEVLNQLRDIHLPTEIGIFPLACGWYFVLIALGFVIIFILYQWLRWQTLKRQLLTIQKLNSQQQPQAIIQLLKYYCVQHQPDIAPRLHGMDWVNWLEHKLDEILSETWRYWIFQGHLRQQPPPLSWPQDLKRWLKQLKPAKKN